jgi:hypothetical protein
MSTTPLDLHMTESQGDTGFIPAPATQVQLSQPEQEPPRPFVQRLVRRDAVPSQEIMDMAASVRPPRRRPSILRVDESSQDSDCIALSPPPLRAASPEPEHIVRTDLVRKTLRGKVIKAREERENKEKEAKEAALAAVTRHADAQLEDSWSRNVRHKAELDKAEAYDSGIEEAYEAIMQSQSAMADEDYARQAAENASKLALSRRNLKRIRDKVDQTKQDIEEAARWPKLAHALLRDRVAHQAQAAALVKELDNCLSSFRSRAAVWEEDAQLLQTGLMGVKLPNDLIPNAIRDELKLVRAIQQTVDSVSCAAWPIVSVLTKEQQDPSNKVFVAAFEEAGRRQAMEEADTESDHE